MTLEQKDPLRYWLTILATRAQNVGRGLKPKYNHAGEAYSLLRSRLGHGNPSRSGWIRHALLAFLIIARFCPEIGPASRLHAGVHGSYGTEEERI